MKVVVIGATGHVGGYLIPRLVGAGHQVVAVSRGTSAPYRDDPAWSHVEIVTADRTAEDAEGTFGARIAALDADVVVDMICFTADSARQLVDAIRGRSRLVMCSTIWVYGTLAAVPATESEAESSPPWGDYGVGKAAIEALLRHEGENGFPSQVLRPGHISGPGWKIINPQGNLDLGVWEALASGGTLLLPNFGLETVHHVHADDVAQAFALAVDAPRSERTEFYNIVSERALTLRGFAEAAAGWFGRDASIEYLPFDEFRSRIADDDARTTYEHIARSHSMSIRKARDELGYAPAHTSLEAVREAVDWLRADGQLSAE
ncbi:NAD-dependent epimerase/dehydratase family protein [Leifsonia poae]|uniref:Reductase n=1 Tax=Leifsonia poae TaxID=110933 RepID=A0A9W6HAC5_9MICO|nr:NAD-dependent epimerase/dehydratase family protein [Leifsonia poae]GLJ76850.1 reductase [Leifsonia poae]